MYLKFKVPVGQLSASHCAHDCRERVLFFIFAKLCVNVCAEGTISQSHTLLRESVLFIGTQYSNLYIAVDMPAKAAMMMMSFICSCRNKKKGAKLHIYLQEGTYHKRLFRGRSTNDMRK